jgi:hypothetical protein
MLNCFSISVDADSQARRETIHAEILEFCTDSALVRFVVHAHFEVVEILARVYFDVTFVCLERYRKFYSGAEHQG